MPLSGLSSQPSQKNPLFIGVVTIVTAVTIFYIS